jgi:g-D-glutamyl-meso-diaminopimelate peptidase
LHEYTESSLAGRDIFMDYVVQGGDTLYKIAFRYNVSIKSIVKLNPQLTNPNKLVPGQVIRIPKPPELPVVIPRSDYGYFEMMEDIDALVQLFPFLTVIRIGRSEMGLSIPAVRIGRGSREIHYNASFHANEWITTLLVMKFLELYAKTYKAGSNIGTIYIPRTFDRTSLWIVPMVNPDGVQLVLNKVDASSNFYKKAVQINGGSTDFRGWKANINGVDLNDQFPAGWETEVQRRSAIYPAPRDYPGRAPLTESESKAMASFTRAHNFRLAAAFHTQGEEIYWGYRGYEPPESQRIVFRFAEVSGYESIRYVESDAGYKDWFIQEWRRPGFTIECGKGINPLPISQFWDIWADVIGIFLTGLVV